MHAFRIGKPCFHASMQNDFSLFIQLKLNFESFHGVFLFLFVFFSGFLGVWLSFQGINWISRTFLFWTNTKMIFVFVLNFEFPKNPCEHVRSCIVLGRKGKTPVVSWVKIKLSVLFAWNKQEKWRHVLNTGKQMILLTRKTHLTEKVLWHYKPNYQ